MNAVVLSVLVMLILSVLRIHVVLALFLGALIGGIRQTQEMLNFCARHRIGADVEVIPASQINEAYERVLSSDVRYRFVIDAATLK